MSVLSLIIAGILLFVGGCQTSVAQDYPDAPGEQSVLPAPPVGHPRLYLGPNHVGELRIRMESPQGKKILASMESAAVERTAAEEAAETDRGFRYYQKMRGLTSRAELDALQYLVYGDKGCARRAITSVLDSLRRTNFPTHHDLSRASGIMLMVGAVVYDWCYDQMSAAERQSYIDEFVRIAGTMECRYPPKRNEYLAGHGSEWMILRDMLSAGIAVYDEYPDMYNYVREMLEEDYIPIRNYVYKGGNYHQGTSYANVRLTCDFISLWILDRMGAGAVYCPEMRYMLYDFIYRRRPDGKVLPAGDVNHIRSQMDVYSMPMMLASSYWKDPYLAAEWELKPLVEPHCKLLELLWRDFDLKSKFPGDLPLSRYSGTPYGWMIARSGWGDDSVIAEMKINEQFFGNHQHLDGGSFQIYYKGPLAIDSGLYQSVQGGYNSANNKCYTKRTVAHNSLLVYDPDEVFECYNYGGADKTRTAANDGGQRLVGIGWDTCRSFEDLLGEEYTVGRVLGHGFGPSATTPQYTFLSGDITKAYSAKVKDVRRSFVYLNLADEVPAALVVYDHVVSSDPSFRKSWLLHSIEEPSLGEGSFMVRRTANGDTGALRCDCILPQGAYIEKIGGPGKEFWVDGVNYPADPQPNRPDVAGERGAWRIELSPSSPAAEDTFLNVIQVMDGDCRAAHGVKHISSPEAEGVIIDGWAVIFCKDLSGFDKSFSIDLPSRSNVLVTGLDPGKWSVRRNGRSVLKDKAVQEGDGSLFIKSAAAGRYEFIR